MKIVLLTDEYPSHIYLRAAEYLLPGPQVVLCAAPDTEAIGREMTTAGGEIQAKKRGEIIWVDGWVPKRRGCPGPRYTRVLRSLESAV